MLNLCSNVSHKQSKFFEILLKKDLKFILNRKNGIIMFKLSFMLLPAKVDSIAKKQDHKGNAFKTCGTGCIQIILALLTKIVALHI